MTNVNDIPETIPQGFLDSLFALKPNECECGAEGWNQQHEYRCPVEVERRAMQREAIMDARREYIQFDERGMV